MNNMTSARATQRSKTGESPCNRALLCCTPPLPPERERCDCSQDGIAARATTITVLLEEILSRRGSRRGLKE
jgi:hypothetical protein